MSGFPRPSRLTRKPIRCECDAGKLDANELHYFFVNDEYEGVQPYHEDTSELANYEEGTKSGRYKGYVTRVDHTVIHCKLCGYMVATHGDLINHGKTQHEDAFAFHVQLQVRL